MDSVPERRGRNVNLTNRRSSFCALRRQMTHATVNLACWMWNVVSDWVALCHLWTQGLGDCPVHTAMIMQNVIPCCLVGTYPSRSDLPGYTVSYHRRNNLQLIHKFLKLGFHCKDYEGFWGVMPCSVVDPSSNF